MSIGKKDEKNHPKNGNMKVVLIVAAMLIATCVIVITHSQEDSDAWGRTFKVDSITYKITSEDEKTVEVNSYDQNSPHVIIPSTVSHYEEEYTVTSIGARSFNPYTDYSGGVAVHRNCKIQDLQIPDTVKIIKKHAICSTMLTSLVIPATVEVIEKDGIADNHKLIRLEIQGEDTILERDSLTGNSLSLLIIPIGLDVVYDNKNVFGNVPSLSTITFTAGSGIGHNYHSGIETRDSYMKTLWYECMNNKGFEIKMNNGITHIGDNMFRENVALKTLKLPDGVNSIGNGAFQGCSSLSYVSFSQDVEYIGNNSFLGCNNLTEISFNTALKEIGENAFAEFRFYDIEGDEIVATAENLAGKNFYGSPDRMIEGV